jgi:hypothetical protein
VVVARADLVLVCTPRPNKLQIFVMALCEEGRLDLLCSLPWPETMWYDEVNQVADILRNQARISFRDLFEDSSSSMVEASGRGVFRGVIPRAPPVDYYRALYAFLMKRGNTRLAATEMYRLYMALKLTQPDRETAEYVRFKIDALSMVCNCLLMEEKPLDRFIMWTYEQPQRVGGHVMSTDADDWEPHKLTRLVTLEEVKQDLAYVFSVSHLLRVADARTAEWAAHLRPLEAPTAEGQEPVDEGEEEEKGPEPPRQREPAKRREPANMRERQVQRLVGLLVRHGLFQSAADVLAAFDLPPTAVVGPLAKVCVELQQGASPVESPFVEEQRPGPPQVWHRQSSIALRRC